MSPFRTRSTSWTSPLTRRERELAAAQRAVDRVYLYRPTYMRKAWWEARQAALQRFLKASGATVRLRMPVPKWERVG